MSTFHAPGPGRLLSTAGLVLATLLTALGLVAGAASPLAQAGEPEKPRASWAVQPSGDNGGAARSHFVYTLRPGTTLRDTVAITNTGRRPVTVDLYSHDAYLTGEEGAFALRTPDEPRTGVGAWVVLGKKTRHVLKPGRGVRVPFEIQVPANAEPGDHAGAILAASTKAERSGGNGALGFDVRRRVGARIYLRVEGPLTPELGVAAFDVEGDPALLPYLTGDGEVAVDYEITNTGNVRMTPEASLELTGPFGVVVDRIPVELPEMLPGSSIARTAVFDTLPPWGMLEARLVVEGPDASATSSARVWSVPWLPALILVLLALAWWARRRYRAGRLPSLVVRGRTEGAAADDAEHDQPAPLPVGRWAVDSPETR